MNILVQHAFGDSSALLDLSGPVHSDYCALRGWAHMWSRDDVGAFKGWPRFALLLQALATIRANEVAVWLDSDSLIVRPEIDLSDALPDDADAAMCTYMNKLHCGALYVRNTKKARAYLDRCARASVGVPLNQAPFFVNDVIEKANVAALGPCWDNWPGAGGTSETETVVQSWHTLPLAEKLEQMKQHIGGK